MPIFLHRLPHPHQRKANAFTLIELMAATTIFLIMMAMIASIVGMIGKTYRKTTSRMEAFADARSSFDQITSHLRQAVLNTYWDYDDITQPSRYERRSELQFLSAPMSRLGYNANTYPTDGVFFQALTGKSNSNSNLPNLLNAYGYFVEFGSDTGDLPSFLGPLVNARYRFRLKEWRVDAEDFLLYRNTSGNTYMDAARNTASTTSSWIDFNSIKPRNFADNILALVILPREPRIDSTTSGASLTSDYVYNSRSGSYSDVQYNQLPPEVEIIMVAIDEPSAKRWIATSTTAPTGWMPVNAFSDPDNLDTDLEDLKSNLDSLRLNYIVMRSSVSIRSARWSQ